MLFLAKVAFSATTVVSQTKTDLFRFTSVAVNYGQSYGGPYFTTFTCPRDGNYWFFYSVVLISPNWATFAIVNKSLTPYSSIIKLHSSFNGTDTITRHVVVRLISYQSLVLSSAYSTYADWTIGSSWGAMNLDMMPIAFEVFALKTTLSAEFSNVIFSEAVLNLGKGWTATGSSEFNFVVPIQGYYYFSYSLGVPLNTTVVVALVSEVSTYCKGQLNNTFVNGTDIVSRGCFVHMNVNEIINMKIISFSGQATSLINNGDTSFRGFLYLTDVYHNIAWSVHADSLVVKDSVISFPNILINEGGAWNSIINQITVPISGTYYIEIVATGVRCDLVLLLNNVTSLLRLTFITDGVVSVTRSRTTIVDLNWSDKLGISSKTDSTFIVSFPISFYGFKIY